MPGPLPKNPKIRQRRNRVATRALLPAESSPIVGTPTLPDNPLGKWHKLTAVWWGDVWASPLHHEYMRADLGALYRLAILVNGFWEAPKLALAAEIRLLEREFGLTPLARRRLEWTVAQTEEAVDRHESARARRAKIIEPADPRGVLK